MMLKNCAGKYESFTLPRRHGGNYHHTPRKNMDDFGDDGAGSQDSSTEYTLLDDASGFDHTVRTCPTETAHEATEAISALKNMCEQLQDQLREAEAIQMLREQEHAVAIRETENRMTKHIMMLEDALDAERAESSRLRQAPLELKRCTDSRAAKIGEARGSSRRRASADGALGSSRGWRRQEQQLLDDRIRSQESSLRSLKSDVAILRRRLRTQAETIEKQKEENEALRRTAKNVARIEDDEITMLASDLDAAILEAETEGQRRRYLEHRLLIAEKRLQKWRNAAIVVNEVGRASGGDNEDDEGSHDKTLPLSRSSFDGEGDEDEETRNENPGRSERSENQSCRGDGKQPRRVIREERGEVGRERDVEVISRSSGTAMNTVATGQRRPEVIHARAKLFPDRRREDRGADDTRSCGGSPKSRPSQGKDTVDTGISSSGRAGSNRVGRCSRSETKSSANGVFRGKTTPKRHGSACRETSERQSSRAPEVRPSPDRCDVLTEEDTRTTRQSLSQEGVGLDETEVAIFEASPLVERAGSARTTLLSDELGDHDVCTPRLGNAPGCRAVPVSAAHMSAAKRGARWSAAIADELRSAVIPAYSSSPVSPSSVANFPEEKLHERDFKSDKVDAGRSPYVPGTFGVADSPLGSGRTRVAAAELLGRLAFSRGVSENR